VNSRGRTYYEATLSFKSRPHTLEILRPIHIFRSPRKNDRQVATEPLARMIACGTIADERVGPGLTGEPRAWDFTRW
jgi:hypothetical protein